MDQYSHGYEPDGFSKAQNALAGQEQPEGPADVSAVASFHITAPEYRIIFEWYSRIQRLCRPFFKQMRHRLVPAETHVFHLHAVAVRYPDPGPDHGAVHTLHQEPLFIRAQAAVYPVQNRSPGGLEHFMDPFHRRSRPAAVKRH